MCITFSRGVTTHITMGFVYYVSWGIARNIAMGFAVCIIDANVTSKSAGNMQFPDLTYGIRGYISYLRAVEQQ